MSTDRIVKTVLLRAPLSRVWRALSDSTEFGAWFGMRFDGPFFPGATMPGVIVPTTANAEIAKMQKPYEGTPFEIKVEQMVPEQLFSFCSRSQNRLFRRTHDARSVYPRAEPDGILVTVTESGFDQIPLARRTTAFSQNEAGWTMVMKLIEEHLAKNP